MSLCLLELKEEQLTNFDEIIEVEKSPSYNKIITIKNAKISINNNYRYTNVALKQLRKRDIEIKTTTKSGKPSILTTGLILEHNYSNDGTNIELTI